MHAVPACAALGRLSRPASSALPVLSCWLPLLLLVAYALAARSLPASWVVHLPPALCKGPRVPACLQGNIEPLFAIEMPNCWEWCAGVLTERRELLGWALAVQPTGNAVMSVPDACCARSTGAPLTAASLPCALCLQRARRDALHLRPDNGDKRAKRGDLRRHHGNGGCRGRWRGQRAAAVVGRTARQRAQHSPPPSHVYPACLPPAAHLWLFGRRHRAQVGQPPDDGDHVCGWSAAHWRM